MSRDRIDLSKDTITAIAKKKGVLVSLLLSNGNDIMVIISNEAVTALNSNQCSPQQIITGRILGTCNLITTHVDKIAAMVILLDPLMLLNLYNDIHDQINKLKGIVNDIFCYLDKKKAIESMEDDLIVIKNNLAFIN
jgi:hypothetical protein